MNVAPDSATALRWATWAGLFIMVQAAAITGWVDHLTLVRVEAMIAALVEGLREGTWNSDIVHTGRTISSAFVLAIGVGIPVGYLLSRWPRIYNIMRPYIESYFSFPVFVLYPAIVVLVGLSLWSMLLVVWMWAVAGVVVNSVIGFARVPASLEKYCDSLELSRWHKIWKMRFPAALPSLVVGAKFALLYSITGTIGVEFILSSRGVGHAITSSYDAFRVADTYALILLVLMVAILPSGLIAAYEGRLRSRYGLPVDYGSPPNLTRQQPRRLGGSILTLSRWLIVPLVAIALWWWLAHAVGPTRLAAPLDTMSEFVRQWVDGPMVRRLIATSMHTLVAFGIAALVGTLSGFVLGSSEFLTRTYSSSVLTARMVPRIVLYPVIIAFLGLTSQATIVFAMVAAIPEITLYTMSAVAAVPRAHVRYGASLGLSRRQQFLSITLPGSLPQVITGYRLGLGICLLGVLVAEMLAGQTQSTGFVILAAAIRNDTLVMGAYILAVFLLTLGANLGMGAVGRLTRQRPPVRVGADGHRVKARQNGEQDE